MLRLRREIVALQERVAVLESHPTRYEQKEATIAAVSRAYDSGYADGYLAGASDALCKVSPDHEEASVPMNVADMHRSARAAQMRRARAFRDEGWVISMRRAVEAARVANIALVRTLRRTGHYKESEK